MEKGQKPGKTEEERHLPRQAVLAKQGESVESDTESLAQERAYQQLQIRVGQYDQIKSISQKENADNSQQGLGAEEDSSEDDLEMYDSLEVSVHPQTKMNPNQLHAEYLEAQTVESQRTRQLLPDDSYSDLRYDPNWRNNLEGAGRFNESPRIPDDERYRNHAESRGHSRGDGEGLAGRAAYFIATSSAPVVASSPRCADRALQLSSSDTDLSGPFIVSSINKSHTSWKRVVGEDSDTKYDHVNLTADIQAMHIRDLQTQYQNELRHTQKAPTQTQQRSTSSLTAHKVSSNGKLGVWAEDIVERNKVTLGRDQSKCGSYLKAYGLKKGMAHKERKVQRTVKETAGAECQKDSSAPKTRFLQKTQVKVPQINKEKKEIPKRSGKPQPPALGVKAEHEDSVISPIEQPDPRAQPKPRKTTSSQQSSPTIHLNIHLNTSSHLLPLLQQTGHDAIINLASLQGYTHWNSASEIALYPGYQQTQSERPTKMPQELEQWQRKSALMWPSSSEVKDQRWSPNEVHTKQFAENFPRTPTPLSQGLGSHAVLPPIGKPTTDRRSEPSRGEDVNVSHPIHKSNSGGYLVQMEKKKQMRERVTYKAYSLKDYKQLKSDIKLQGLGPDYAATEKTAEKMKRQKLYSSVIREQNKKISRIPFPPTKDAESSDKKFPRMKALEYAKTIAKPPVQSQPKQRQKHQPEGFVGHVPYLEGLDVTQLAMLELLRKRHEEEKRAVALFRKVHAV
ncbi:jhy protein homolog [Mugil cephalus]|uniref:jhy protein homolog n=1 Tax=Mugil cephalus TaxID=48193 RepID=UPI001FB6BB89|nr:jhy protein homolog [Mugil cephalus]